MSAARWCAWMLLVACAFPAAAAAQDEPTVSEADLPRACAQAADLVASGNLDDAEALYRSLLGRAHCDAAAGLADVQTAKSSKAESFETRAGKIRALQREGFDDEASKELQKLVADFPNKDIPEDIRKPTAPVGWWGQALAWIGPPIVTGLEILAVVLGFVVAYFVIRFFVRRSLPGVQLAGFVGSEDKTLDATLASALNDHLLRLKEHGSSRELMSQSAADVAFSLPETVVAAVPQANLVASLLTALDKLVPRKIVEVKGTARPVDPIRGAGLTVTVSQRGGHVLAQQTVWEREYLLLPSADAMDKELATRYGRLLAPAAVWLAYQRELGYNASAPPLETTSWRSYALFAAAEIAQREVRLDDARRAYEGALDEDAKNLGARLNLGVLLLKPKPAANGYPDETPEAEKERLDRARALLAHVRERANDWSDPLAYRTRYVAAIGALYANRPVDTFSCVHELHSRIRANRDDESLRPMLTKLQPAVVALRESARVLIGMRPNEDILEGDWVPLAAQYNASCVYNRWADATTSGAERLERRRKALDRLAAVLTRAPELRSSAKLDPALKSIRADADFKAEWEKLVDPATTTPEDGADRSDRLRVALRELIAAAVDV